MSSMSIDSTSILSAIAKLEGDLAKLKIALGVPDVVVPKKSRKSPVKADGEKKGPNVWIQFTQKVDAALKAAEISTGAATVAKQFASSLKDSKPYTEWTDESIVEAWATWEKPEQSKTAKAASESEASDSGSEKKERKKRTPMTEEAKAAAALKRAAKKAAKAAEAPTTEAPTTESATESASESSAEEGAAPSEKKERKKRAPMTEEAKKAAAEKRAATKAAKKTAAEAAHAGMPLPASEPVSDAEAPAPASAKSAAFKPKKVAATYTLEQLKDFEPFTLDGVEYGKNVRGDVCDSDEGNYVGNWDGTKIVKGAAPADWASVQPSA